MKRYRLSIGFAWRATATVAATMLAATGTASAALADPAQHTTDTFTDTYTSTGPVTCAGGPTYTLTHNVTITDYLVSTSGQSSTRHDRSTFSESFTGTPLDPTLPTVTGTTEGPANFHYSYIGAAGETANALTTATYSDGTTVRTHATLHFTIRHDGTIVTNFDKCS
jgi:hypothetical protein